MIQNMIINGTDKKYQFEAGFKLVPFREHFSPMRSLIK